MKNMFKTISAVAGLLGALSAMADVGTIDLVITNKVINNATTVANVSSNSVNVANQDNCGFEFRFQGDQAGTGAITVTFARSPDNVTWETTPKFTWITALNGNTAVVAYTNFTSQFIGAAGYLKVLSIQNADASASATNCVLRLVKKTVKPAS